MKIKQVSLRRKLVSSVALVLASMSTGIARADENVTPEEVFTWGGAGGAWSASSGWTGGTAPTGLGIAEKLLFGGDSAYTTTNDLAVRPFYLGGMLLNPVVGGDVALISSVGTYPSHPNLRFVGGGADFEFTGAGNATISIPFRAVRGETTTIDIAAGAGILTLGPTPAADTTGPFIGGGMVEIINNSSNVVALGNLGSIFSGDLRILAGAVKAGRTPGGDLLGAVTTLHVAAGASFDFNGNGEDMGTIGGAGTINLGVSGGMTIFKRVDADFAGSITQVAGGAGAFGKSVESSNSTLTLRGISTYGGNTNFSSGIVRLTDAGAIINTNQFTVNNGARLILDNTGTANVADRMRDGAAVLLAGELSLQGADGAASTETVGAVSFTGGTGASRIAALAGTGGTATLTAASLGNRGARGQAMLFETNAGGTINFTTAPSLVNGIIGGHAFMGGDFATIAGNSVVPLANYETSTDPLNWSGTENVKISAAPIASTGIRTINSLNIAVAETVDVGLSTDTLTIASGGIVASASGTIANGRLISGQATNKELVINVQGALTRLLISSTLDNTNNLTKVGDGTLALSGANSAMASGVNFFGGFIEVSDVGQLGSATNTLTFTGGGLKLGANVSLKPASGTRTINVANGAGATFDTNGFELTLPVLTGAGVVTKTGAGVLLMDNTSAFIGDFVIKQGEMRALSVSSGDYLGGSTYVQVDAGAIFNIQSNAEDFGGFHGAGTVTAANSGVNFRQDGNRDVTFSGILQEGAFFMSGPATMTVSGASTYTGTTIVEEGTLRVMADALPGVAGPLGAATSVVGVGTTTASNSLDAALIIGAAGVTIGRDVEARAATTPLGVVQFGSNHTTGTSTFSGAITLNRNAELTVAAGGQTDFTGTIGGTNGLVMVGAGTAALTNPNGNTYSGDTYVPTGTLLISNSAGSATGVGNVHVSGGATLGGEGLISGTVNLRGANIAATGTGIGVGGSVNVLSTGNVIGGVLTAPTGVALTANSALQLTGTIAGPLSVASGSTLTGNGSITGIATLSSATVNGTGLSFTGGATFSGTGNTLAGAVLAPVGVNVAGSLALPGALTGNLALGAGSTLTGSGSVVGAINATSATINSDGLSATSVAFDGAGNTLSGALASPVSVGAGASLGLQSATITGALNVATAGTVSGNATVAGGISLAGGGSAVAPGGAALGLITTSALSMGAGSILNFDLAGPGISDTLAVTGNNGLTIDGATINFTNTGGLFTGTYNLISYSGTIQGAGFAGLSSTPSNIGLFSLTLQNNPGSIDLVVGLVGLRTWSGAVDSNWDTTTGNWTGDTNTYADGLPVKFDTGGANAIINLASDVAPGLVVVTGTTNYSIGGAGRITGTTDLVKSGTSTLTLSGNHTFTGAVSIEGGAIALADVTDAGVAGPLGAANSALKLGTTVAAGTLAYTAATADSTNRALQLSLGGGKVDVTDPAGVLTLSGSIAGAGNFTKLGAGTLVLAGTTLHTGGTTVSAGTLRTTTANLGGNVSVLTGGIFQLDQATDGAFAGNITGSGELLKTGAGILTLTGINSHTGSTTVSAGTLSGAAPSIQGNILNNAAVVFDQNVDGTFAGDISGTGTITKLGAAALTLSGVNTYTGGTTVSAGTLIGTSSSLQGNIANEAAVVFEQDTNGTFGGVISGGGSVTKRGTGAVTIESLNSFTGNMAIAAGSLVTNTLTDAGTAGPLGAGFSAVELGGFEPGRLVYTGPSASSNRAFAVGGAAGGVIEVTTVDQTLTLTGDMGTALRPLTFTGAGNVTLQNFNLQGNRLTKEGTGTLTLLNSTAAINGQVIVTDGILAIDTVNRLAGSTAAVSIGRDGGSATVRYSGPIETSNRPVVVSGAAGIAIINISDPGGALFLSASSTSSPGQILRKTGPGTLILNDANALAGLLEVLEGTVQSEQIGSPGDFFSGNLYVAAGAVFELFNNGEDFGYLAGDGQVNPNMGSTATVNPNSALDTTFSGTYGGTGSFAKRGTGTLTLTGSSPNLGAFNLENGTVSIPTIADAGMPSPLGAGTPINIGTTANATLRFTGFFGATNRSITINAFGANFDVTEPTGELTLTGVVAGTGSLTKSGPGTLTLATGANYAGGTFIRSGTVKLSGAANRLPTSSIVTLGEAAGSGVLDLNDQSQILAGLVVAGTGTDNRVINSGSQTPALTIAPALNSNGTFTGTLGGGATGNALSLVKSGPGSLTLTASNHTFSGGTTITTGQLILGTADANLGTGLVQVAGGTLAGIGNVAAPVSVSNLGRIAPGIAGIGTMNLQTLTLEPTSGINFDLGALGTSDFVQINGAGGLTINGGRLEFTNAGGLQAGTYPLIGYTGAIGGAGFAALGPSAPVTVDGFLISLGIDADSINAIVTALAGAKTWTGAVDGNWDGTTTNWSGGLLYVAGDNVSFGDGATTTDVVIPSDVAPVAVTFSSSANYSLTGPGKITGATGISKTGAGDLTINSDHTFTGPVNVARGTLIVGKLADAGVASPLGAGSIATPITLGSVNYAGTLRYTGAVGESTNREYTMGDLGGTIDITTTEAVVTLAGPVGGTGSLTKAGPGTLVLSGNNNFQGPLKIDTGTVRVSSSANLGNPGNSLSIDAATLIVNGTFATARSVAVTGPATIEVAATQTLTLDGSVSGPGSLTKLGDGTLVLNATNSHVAGTNVLAGTLAVSTGGALSGTGSVTLDNGATLRFLAPATSTRNIVTNSLGGIIDTNGFDVSVGGGSGAGTFTKNGEGTLSATAAWAGLTGDLIINAGTFRAVGNTDIIGDQTTIIVAAGAVFDDTAGNGENFGNLAGAGEYWERSGNGIDTGRNNLDAVFTGVIKSGTNGVIGGSSNVTKRGTGTWTLGGVNEYLGNTNIVDGMVILGIDDSLPAPNPTTNYPGTALSFGSATTVGVLDLAGFDQAVKQITVTGTNPNGANNTITNTSTTDTSVLSINNESDATYSGSITGNVKLVKYEFIAGNPFATLTLSGPLSYTGDTEVQVGKLVVGALETSPNIKVGTDTTSAQIDAKALRNAALTLSANSTATLLSDGSDAGTSRLAALNLSGSVGAWTSRLELNNNDLIVAGGNYATVLDQVKAGRGTGEWDGVTGITSAAALNDATNLTALGVIRNVNTTGAALYAEFGGQPTAINDVLVKYTWVGDADLNGVVDIDDYFAIDVAYASGTAGGWAAGDFNYSGGAPTADDYFLIDAGFIGQSSVLAGGFAPVAPAAPTAAVPEPAELSLLALGAVALLGRRRRTR